MRDKDTSALREIFQYDCDPHLKQTKFNGLLPLTIADVLVQVNLGRFSKWRTSLTTELLP